MWGVDWRVVHRVLVGSALILSVTEGGTLDQTILLTVYVATWRAMSLRLRPWAPYSWNGSDINALWP